MSDTPQTTPTRSRRVDAQRNEQALVAAAAATFVASGVDAPIRDIAAEAGVGLATMYRHFPTRSDLIVAVYHHQIEVCAQAGPELLHQLDSPVEALRRWAAVYTDFLVTKHGFAAALRSDDASYERLQSYLEQQLIPVCAQLIGAAEQAGQIAGGADAYELMRGICGLCIGGATADYEPRRLVQLLISGLERDHPLRLPRGDPSRTRIR